jgi:hypothetical protein
VTAWRRDLCLAWVGLGTDGGPVRRRFKRFGARLRIAVFCGIRPALRLQEGAPEYAARVLYGKRDYGSAFGLLEALLAVTGNGSVQVGATPGQLHVHGAATNGTTAAVEPELERV